MSGSQNWLHLASWESNFGFKICMRSLLNVAFQLFLVQWLRAELRCNDIEPVVSKWRLGQRGHFEVFHVV